MKAETPPVRRFFQSRLFWLVTLPLLGIALVGLGRAYYQDYQVAQEIRALQDQVGQLQKKKIESATLLSYVMSPDFVEERGRTELNLKKPGEQVLVIPQEHRTVGTTTTGPLPESKASNPVRWWYYFTVHHLPVTE